VTKSFSDVDLMRAVEELHPAQPTANEIYFHLTGEAPSGIKQHAEYEGQHRVTHRMGALVKKGWVDVGPEKRCDQWSRQRVTTYRLPTGALAGLLNVAAYEILTTPEEFEDLLDRIGDKPCALDFEGWDYKVRTAQFCNDDVWAIVDFGDMDVHNWFPEVAHWMEDGTWIAFSSGHEKQCLAAAGAAPTVWDVAHLYRAKEGGGHLSLKLLAGYVLNIQLDKTEQVSQWNTGELTQRQLNYAADDARHTWNIWKTLKDTATPGQLNCFNLLDSMTDATMEMQAAGLRLDPEHHKALVAHWRELNDARETRLRELVTEDEVPNLNSGKQLNDFFSRLLPDGVLDAWPKTEKTGLLSTKNRDLMDLAGMLGDVPLLSETFRLMAERSSLQKYISSFGDTLLHHARKTGRIHARYNIAAAVTCRFSCSGPNLQQIPRDREFFGERMSIRRGFIPEDGNVMVSFDYSGIEMVMIAILSGDEQLLHDVLYGNVHAEAGAMIAGRPLDLTKVEDKEIRQQGKPVNFGIVYGTTALGLAGRQGWSFERAEKILQGWAARYPKAWNYRFLNQLEAKRTGYLTMVDGGTIYLGKQRPGLTKCANYPVQRAALSVMARAIVRHHESMQDLRERYPSEASRLLFCSTIHDALIDEAPAAMGEVVRDTMRRDMVAAYYDIFPDLEAPEDRLLEGGMGPNWADLEKA